MDPLLLFDLGVLAGVCLLAMAGGAIAGSGLARILPSAPLVDRTGDRHGPGARSAPGPARRPAGRWAGPIVALVAGGFAALAAARLAAFALGLLAQALVLIVAIVVAIMRYSRTRSA